MKRLPKPKPNTIKVAYGRLNGDDPDYCVIWGDGARTGSLLALSTIQKLCNELELSGYDKTTVRFEITRKSACTAAAPNLA